jgi:hypothetical protein
LVEVADDATVPPAEPVASFRKHNKNQIRKQQEDTTNQLHTKAFQKRNRRKEDRPSKEENTLIL